MNISKAIDKKLGAEREVIGKGTAGKTALGQGSGWNKTYNPHEYDITRDETEQAKRWSGWGTALKPANEPIILARKPLSEATVAENVLKWGTGAINIDGCRVGTEQKGGEHKDFIATSATGRFPANVLLDEEAAAMLDEQSGMSKSVRSQRGAVEIFKKPNGWIGATTERGHDDSGGASRFFYVAKASKRERTHGGQVENNHPTVKPIKLMRYLCRLATPPGGTVLDPFAGSGTTILAAVQEGFSAIGIEKESEYCEIIRKRMAEVQPALPLAK